MSDETHEVDLLIVGSGAAAMSAGIRANDLGLDTLLVEKSATYGGSTAMSGGVCWVGNNSKIARAGIPDSDEETLEYLRAITKGEVAEERLGTYVRESKRMLEYFADHTEVSFEPLEEYSDYYAELPGGKPGGRSMEPDPFDGSRLGDDFKDLQRPADSALVMGKFMITARAAKRMIILGLGSVYFMLSTMIRYALRYFKRKRFGRDTYLTNGNALAGRLRLSLKQRNVPLWLNTGASELIREDGRVVGAKVERDGKPLSIRARKGVLLACGGFERNLAMREKHGPAPASTGWTAGNLENTGDGIVMGEQLGASTSLMDEAWWTPVTQYPGVESGWVLVVEKSLPGGIFVNGNGERFTNEAAPYVDVVVETYKDHQKTGCSVPVWMVFDGRYRHNYIAGPVGPGKFLPDSTLARRVREKLLVKASSVDGLAEKLGVDAARLQRTIERYNGMCASGKDEDFGRGDYLSDRYYGDHRVTPNPCMAPLTQAPYYAIPVYPGDLGTKGGLDTDVHGRVLDGQGSVLPGLYAAGNTSASMMGRSYPGAGGTIGPALCFGFLAAEHAAGEVADSKDGGAPQAVA